MNHTALPRRPFWRDVRNWAMAGTVVVAAHASVGYGVASFSPGPKSTDLGPIMEIDLAPINVSEAEPVDQETLQEEQSQEVAELETPPEEFVEEQVEEAEPETTETVEEAPEEIVEAEPEPVETVEEAPVVEKAEVVLPTPKPKPVKPPPRKIVKKVEPKPVVKKPQPTSRQAAPTAKKAQNAGSRQAAQTGRAGATKPSAAVLRRWNSQLVSAIQRRKPRSVTGAGRVSVRLVVGAGGALMSASVARSSGNATLDSAALQMVRSARLPPPPPELGRPPFTRTAPIEFR